MGILRTAIVGVVALGGLSAAANYGVGSWLRGQPTIESVQTTGWPLQLGADMRGVELPGLALSGADVRAPVWSPLSLSADIMFPVALQGHILDGMLTGETATADVTFGYAADLPVKSLALHMTKPVVTFDAAPDMPLAADQTDGTLIRQPDGTYALDAVVGNLRLPQGSAERYLPGTGLEDVVENVTAKAALTFAVPPSARGAVPELDAVTISNLAMAWGGRSMSVTGTLTANPAGMAEGTLNLTTTDWQAWLAVARNAGWLRGNDRLVEMVLRGLAANSTNNSITVPVNFASGRMSIGPLPTNLVVRLR